MQSRQSRTEVLPGTLDLLLLKALSLEPMHGFGVGKRLEQITGGAFRVNAGSLFPALHGLEERGWIRGEWGRSDNNRRARYYRLTPAGRRRLVQQADRFRRTVSNVLLVLEST
ncbi:MAG TPA: PadR family transcriptional regulator [Vicinamibacterales bacterium]|nr:PadR family transcriptional regulator [Vicinamibacterales bacterium]